MLFSSHKGKHFRKHFLKTSNRHTDLHNFNRFSLNAYESIYGINIKNGWINLCNGWTDFYW